MCPVSVLEPLYFDHVNLFTSRKGPEQFMCPERNECLFVGAGTASDHQRLEKMFLYISAYGLTAYRILSLTFMLWLTDYICGDGFIRQMVEDISFGEKSAFY